jgi:hypothetical protein
LIAVVDAFIAYDAVKSFTTLFGVATLPNEAAESATTTLRQLGIYFLSYCG